MLFTKKETGAEAFSNRLDTLKREFAGAPKVTAAVAKAAISMEGIGALAGELEQAEQNLNSSMQSVFHDLKARKELSIAQEHAGLVAGMVAGAPAEYMSRPPMTDGELLASFGGRANVVVMGSSSIGLEKRGIAAENFDTAENKNVQAYSVMYNTEAAKSDAFGEAFFPTVVLTPDTFAYSVSVRLIHVIDDLRRDASGAVNDFKRKNIVRASVDASILRNDITKIVPVYRTGGAHDSSAYFNADIGTTTVKVNGEDVVTGPLVFGKAFSLLGISQTDAALSNGMQDITDALDPAMILSNVYVKLADGDIVKIRTEGIPTSSFNQALQGNVQECQLAFTAKAMQVKGTTLKVDGTPLTGAATLGANSARLAISVRGGINRQEGTVDMPGGNVSFSKAYDADGNELATSSGAGAAIKALFAGATVVAWDISAFRTNSNKRNRGLVIDNQETQYMTSVPILPPISALRPISSTDANDASLLMSLVHATQKQTANVAVTTLIQTKDLIKDAATPGSNFVEMNPVIGSAREIVNLTYLEAVIDCAAEIDSIKSADRANDLNALLFNKIRDMAFRLYRNSNYQSAVESQTPGVAKTTVIIGTDPITYRYLTISGDTRLLGDAFDFKIVMSQDSRMVGKVFITLGQADAFTSGQPNALHFGNMAWKPEFTIITPMTRNGTVVQELTVQPMYRHVVNLPVMGYIEVNGIEDVIASKVAINTHPV